MDYAERVSRPFWSLDRKQRHMWGNYYIIKFLRTSAVVRHVIFKSNPTEFHIIYIRSIVRWMCDVLGDEYMDTIHDQFRTHDILHLKGSQLKNDIIEILETIGIFQWNLDPRVDKLVMNEKNRGL